MTLETSVRVSNLTKGAIYRVRYRASNQIGSGPWGDIAYLRVAQKPQPPTQPIVTYFDNTRISLKLSISSDDGGSGIISYHLFIDEGLFGSMFEEVTDYDGHAQTYSLNVGQVVGSITMAQSKFYTIKYLALNAVGLSQDSTYTYIALARAPQTPTAPTFNESKSTRH